MSLFRRRHLRSRSRHRAGVRRSWPARLGRALVFGLGLAALLGLLLPPALLLPLRWLDPPTSAFMLRAQWTGLNDRAPCTELHWQWRPLATLSAELPLAVVASEDQKFPQHRGFDWAAIADNLEQLDQGRRAKGASTLSQQTVKNLVLWPGRSWWRKGLEAYLTLWLETLWPKQRILEVYLNLAEFGPCTFGAQAASARYFGRDAGQLSRYQASLMAAVLPNPHRLTLAAPSDYVRGRAREIRRQMRALGGTAYLQEVLKDH